MGEKIRSAAAVVKIGIIWARFVFLHHTGITLRAGLTGFTLQVQPIVAVRTRHVLHRCSGIDSHVIGSGIEACANTNGITGQATGLENDRASTGRKELVHIHLHIEFGIHTPAQTIALSQSDDVGIVILVCGVPVG